MQEMAIFTEEKVITTSYTDVTDRGRRLAQRSGNEETAKGCVIQ